VENERKRSRLRGRQDFERIQSHGKSYRINEWLLLAFLKKESGVFRAGWTVPRYVGTAVTRNRLKRWLRESLRLNQLNKKIYGLDVNFVFLNRGPAFYKGLSYEKVNQSIFHAIKKFQANGNCNP